MDNTNQNLDQETQEQINQPGVVEALVEEIKERIALSQKYQSAMEQAKTNVKKQIYQKKLIKNNDQLADMFIALDRIQAAREKRNQTVDKSGE